MKSANKKGFVDSRTSTNATHHASLVYITVRLLNFDTTVYSDTPEEDPSPTDAGLRPFLSGLNYHPWKNFYFLWLAKQFSVVFTYEIFN